VNKKVKSSGSEPRDFSAQIRQSSVDKLLDSTGYPLRVVDKSESFPGCDRKIIAKSTTSYAYTAAELDALLESAVRNAGKGVHGETIDDEVFSWGGSVIEQAKRVLDASASGGEKFRGPPEAYLKAIVDGGIGNLRKTLGDIELYAHLRHLYVIVSKRPSITLSSPRIDLNGIRITVGATGEAWMKFPWFNCYKGCLEWKKVTKCERIASVSASLDIKCEAHALVEASGAKVFVRGVFDKLRLDYPILKEIPLEKFANEALRDRAVFVYDAAKLVASVPVFESKFSIDRIALPNIAGGIDIGVSLKQLK
jgi:hypothetical protein